MSLYMVQDIDGPAWVFASSYREAIEKWQAAVAEGNCGEIFEPDGVSQVARDCDLIIRDRFLTEEYLNEPEEGVIWLAKIAYEAYCETTGWKSAVTGADLPPFNKTPQAVQEGWVVAVMAVTVATDLMGGLYG